MTIEQELSELNAQLRPLLARKEQLERELRREKSRAWIKANGVTREQVELSTGDDRDRIQSAHEFGKYLSKLPDRKRFCEWNGQIMFTEEFISRGLSREPTANMGDLD